MQYYKIVQLSLHFFTYLGIFCGIFLLYTIYKGYRYTGILSKKVYDLGKEITAEKIEDFISCIDTKYIPFRFYTHGLIKAGCRLVNMEECIDIELKRKLKTVALSKGILVDWRAG